MGSGAVWGLAMATFVATAVEVVEALTVVLAMGVTRGWRSALVGTGAALVALAGFTAVTGYALVTWLPRSVLQLTVGTLLLIFGLQWLRKAILRSSGHKAIHDEDAAFRKQTEAARAASSQRRLALDWFSFVISFKATFLEGVEVVFIVITFGLNAGNVPVAVIAAAAAVVIVGAAGALARAPLTRVPENTLKYGVGLMLASFGTFWAVEGLGVLRAGGESLTWPGGDAAILALLAGWFLLSRALVARYRKATEGLATEGATR
ncbi:MAG: hypothetical protein QOI21_265 [Actinomycetota bacterium]|jgi:uncharacterized membrane protein|nr:hypothetical protein [Actinomycetota bacterium]